MSNLLKFDNEIPPQNNSEKNPGKKGKQQKIFDVLLFLLWTCKCNIVSNCHIMKDICVIIFENFVSNYPIYL